jgi:hypothetical protein
VFFMCYQKPEESDNNSMYGWYSLVIETAEGDKFGVEGITRAGDCGSPYFHCETGLVIGFHTHGTLDEGHLQYATGVFSDLVQVLEAPSIAKSVGAKLEAPKSAEKKAESLKLCRWCKGEFPHPENFGCPKFVSSANAPCKTCGKIPFHQCAIHYKQKKLRTESATPAPQVQKKEEEKVAPKN